MRVVGYETEDMQQLVPRKIQAPSLKRQEIVGTAAYCTLSSGTIPRQVAQRGDPS